MLCEWCKLSCKVRASSECAVSSAGGHVIASGVACRDEQIEETLMQGNGTGREFPTCIAPSLSNEHEEDIWVDVGTIDGRTKVADSRSLFRAGRLGV